MLLYILVSKNLIADFKIKRTFHVIVYFEFLFSFVTEITNVLLPSFEYLWVFSFYILCILSRRTVSVLLFLLSFFMHICYVYVLHRFCLHTHLVGPCPFYLHAFISNVFLFNILYSMPLLVIIRFFVFISSRMSPYCWDHLLLLSLVLPLVCSIVNCFSDFCL